MIIAPMLDPSLPSSLDLWRPRLVTFLLAACAAASVGYWVLQWPAPSDKPVAVVPAPEARPIDTAKVAQLLGATADTGLAGGQNLSVSAAVRYKLIGVIALGSRDGSALIAVDGQPARPFRVGDHLGDDLVLQSVNHRSVSLANDQDGNSRVTLELPPVPGGQ